MLLSLTWTGIISAGPGSPLSEMVTLRAIMCISGLIMCFAAIFYLLLVMFQKYHLKWCLILILVLAGGTSFLRVKQFDLAHLWNFVTHFVIIMVNITSSWILQVFMRRNMPANFGKSAAVIRVIASMALGVLLNIIVTTAIPPQYLFEDIIYAYGISDVLRMIIGAFFLSMVTHIILNVIYANEMLQQTQLEMEHLKQAHLRAQLLSLQQQISPHFLFNSLSTLKNIAHDTDTKKFVIQLSHVYRYLLSFNEKQVTRLADELAFIDSYLYILYQRFESSLTVAIRIPERYYNYQIPPLSIQLLIENAIKHNALSPEAPLHIDIYMNEENEVVVSNICHPKKFPVESTRLGLQNINERFQLLFSKKITVSATDEYFTVKLPVISHESYYH